MQNQIPSMKNIVLLFFILISFFSAAQNSEAKNEMYRFKNGKSLEKALKDPLNAVYVSASDYTDSVFPNAAILQLKNVEHLVVAGRFCRDKKGDSLLAPLKVRIDSVALKSLTKLKYLELTYFDFHEFPVAICSLTQLKGLSIAVSFLDSIPDEIARMKSLQLVEFRLNELHSLPAVFSTMDSLVEIDLANNRFTKIPEVTLQMKNLQSLILSNIETDQEFIGDWRWPFRMYINRINYYKDTKTLLSLLKSPSLRHIYIQVNTTEEQNRILDTMLAGDDSKKIYWRIAQMN